MKPVTVSSDVISCKELSMGYCTMESALWASYGRKYSRILHDDDDRKNLTFCPDHGRQIGFEDKEVGVVVSVNSESIRWFIHLIDEYASLVSEGCTRDPEVREFTPLYYAFVADVSNTVGNTIVLAPGSPPMKTKVINDIPGSFNTAMTPIETDSKCLVCRVPVGRPPFPDSLQNIIWNVGYFVIRKHEIDPLTDFIAGELRSSQDEAKTLCLCENHCMILALNMGFLQPIRLPRSCNKRLLRSLASILQNVKVAPKRHPYPTCNFVLRLYDICGDLFESPVHKRLSKEDCNDFVPAKKIKLEVSFLRPRCGDDPEIKRDSEMAKAELLNVAQQVTDESLKRRLNDIDLQVMEFLDENPKLHCVNILEQRYQKMFCNEKFDQLHKEIGRFVVEGLADKSVAPEDIANDFIQFNNRGCFGTIACQSVRSLKFWINYLNNEHKVQFTVANAETLKKMRKLSVKLPRTQFPVGLSVDDFLVALKGLNNHIDWNLDLVACVSNEENHDLWCIFRMDEKCYRDLEKKSFKVTFISGFLTFSNI